MKVEEIKNKEIWEDFLSDVEDKSFLISWNWGIFQEEMGNKIWRFGFFDGGELSGLALVSKVIAKRGTFFLIQHGPAVKGDKNQIISVLLEKLKELGKREKVDFIRVNPLWPDTKENRNLLKKFGFINSPMHASSYEATLRLDISPSEEDLLMSFRKTTRYLIRQTLNNKDISVETSDDVKDIESFQVLNERVSKKHNFIPFSFDFVKKEFEVFSRDNQALLFLGKYKGELVAASLIIFWSGNAFYHQAGSNEKYIKLSVPYLLQWEAIKEAKRRGCRFYDFWGYVDPKDHPKHPWAGPTLFKMGFTREKTEYVKTQDFPLSFRYWLINLFERIRKIKRGL